MNAFRFVDQELEIFKEQELSALSFLFFFALLRFANLVEEPLRIIPLKIIAIPRPSKTKHG